MAVVSDLVVAAGFLLLLFWLVLSTVRRLRPRSFRFKATLTKWVSLDLEMRSPEDSHKAIGGSSDETGSA